MVHVIFFLTSELHFMIFTQYPLTYQQITSNILANDTLQSSSTQVLIHIYYESKGMRHFIMYNKPSLQCALQESFNMSDYPTQCYHYISPDPVAVKFIDDQLPHVS